MARTAPVPNIPAIPGMNPGVFILGGGGGGGGSDGAGGRGGKGRQGAGGSNGGKSASGGGKGALDPQRYPLCGTKSHPVDVATGRAFTHPSVIVELPGPLPLRLTRSYSSTACERDVGLGWGWAHALGWHIEERRRTLVVNPMTDHNFHTLCRFDSPVGYANGEPTRWLRAEYASGSIHGHPRPLSEVRKFIPDAEP
ncbi:DUF6531 domain-containing protein [Sorangium sp. So ce406]|uniref:DUF6531 domain-containing protein n=1 Tax=Sorangium sp. So ce406 TaxID=3133311 RepID=UPI003F5C76E7